MTENLALDTIRRFFTVATRGRTYANVAYVWLGFPLGIAYFVFLVTGFALSLGLSLLWIGLILAVLFVICIKGLGQFERVLSQWLLGEALPAGPHAETRGVWQWVTGVFKDASTWKGALFLFLKFPLGIMTWIASVFTFTLAAAFIAAPFSEFRGEVDFGYWILQDPTGGWLMSLAGVLLLFATLHLHNAMGWLWRMMSRGLLSSGTMPQAA
jgi:hypothetical protein